MSVAVFLAPTAFDAFQIVEEMSQAGLPVATVKAEYGSTVVEGRDAPTLATRTGAYVGRPTPCIAELTPLEKGTIVVSRLDLDTIGACLALMGQKPGDENFWAGAAYLQVRGPHRSGDLPEHVREQLDAWSSWSESHLPLGPFRRTIDVTVHVVKAGEAIQAILSGDRDLIAAGRQWAAGHDAVSEARLVDESPLVRVFVTEGPRCSAAYYSPRLGRIVPATVVLDSRQGTITVACEGGQFDARLIVRELWGSGAGGRPGIAESPRDRRMGLPDLIMAVNVVSRAVEASWADNDPPPVDPDAPPELTFIAVDSVGGLKIGEPVIATFPFWKDGAITVRSLWGGSPVLVPGGALFPAYPGFWVRIEERAEEPGAAVIRGRVFGPNDAEDALTPLMEGEIITFKGMELYPDPQRPFVYCSPWVTAEDGDYVIRCTAVQLLPTEAYLKACHKPVQEKRVQ
ncbi:hypothetical protein HM1_2454 [Heliomicrobium modesticaldum Ice1]|uniref:Uncharacterized protein n=1 Tax=Heliobacterium modesticaldum (strain ATCC 51547 / Ice1) TaxID=498761 RepID=B0TAF4_HELMI|nr:hypothetical protein [Heliomicrobium modesticaldum]ABZ85004.1 hypothetical protein HM1_2454 [Heliomicrobium modesticaldum Ice1]